MVEKEEVHLIDAKEHDRRLTASRWKVRITIDIIMLVLAFVGLFISDTHPKGNWLYWRIVAPIFAVLCIWLGWYMRRNLKLVRRHIMHDILLWIGLLVAFYLVSLLVDRGIMGSLEAGFVALILLSLTTYIAGIFIESTFMLIGLSMAVFVVAAVFFETQLSLIMLPVFILALVVLLILVRRGRGQAS
jgi:hypothetical protein